MLGTDTSARYSHKKRHSGYFYLKNRIQGKKMNLDNEYFLNSWIKDTIYNEAIIVINFHSLNNMPSKYKNKMFFEIQLSWELLQNSSEIR